MLISWRLNQIVHNIQLYVALILLYKHHVYILYLYNLILKYFSESFWMGGTDEFVEGHWIWISTMDKMTFTDWGQGYHDGHDSHEDCLQIQAGGRWKDAVCSVRSNFICEVPYVYI